MFGRERGVSGSDRAIRQDMNEVRQVTHRVARHRTTVALEWLTGTVATVLSSATLLEAHAHAPVKNILIHGTMAGVSILGTTSMEILRRKLKKERREQDIFSNEIHELNRQHRTEE